MALTPPLKACNACRFFIPNSYGTEHLHRCSNPLTASTVNNYITGMVTQEQAYAQQAREFGTCGPDGKFWIAK